MGDGCSSSCSCCASFCPTWRFRVSCRRFSIFLVWRRPNTASGFWILFPSLSAMMGSCRTASSSRWPKMGFNPMASRLWLGQVSTFSATNKNVFCSLVLAARHSRAPAWLPGSLTLLQCQSSPAAIFTTGFNLRAPYTLPTVSAVPAIQHLSVYRGLLSTYQTTSPESLAKTYGSQDILQLLSFRCLLRFARSAKPRASCFTSDFHGLLSVTVESTA
jgi:hypothetical protein